MFTHWLYQILRFPLWCLTRFKTIADQHDSEASDPQHIVYVMHGPSLSDFAVLRRVAKALSLPDPYTKLHIHGKEFPRVLFADDKHKRLPYDSLTPFQDLLQLHHEHADLNVLMVPVALFWGRLPGQDARKGKTIVGDSEHLSRWQKFWIVLFSGRHILVRVSKPVNLKMMAETYADEPSQELGLKLMRVARTHFARLRYAVAGPKLSSRQTIINEILRLPAIQKSIQEEAKSKKISEVEAYKQAEKYLQEIAADYREGLIRLGDRLLTWLWSKIYQGVTVRGSERLRELAQQGHEIIYIPCHRSHMDYLLLSYTIYKEGLVPPHIAAGVNLNFFPVGGIFRRGGAFFIRRSFRGNKLYGAIFREYLNLLFQKGYAVEYFTEGGRSRTGRLLAPKTGMLAMTVQGLLRGVSRPITLVPVYIGYEHVMEVQTYHKELSGKNKQKESLFQVFGIIRKLRNFGMGFVSFGEPLRLSDYLDEYEPTWRDSVTLGVEDPSKPKWLTPCVNELGDRVMRRINQAAAINVMNLSALSLLSAERKTLHQDVLLDQIQAYAQLQAEAPYHSEVVIGDLLQDKKALWQHALNMNKFQVEYTDIGNLISLSASEALSMTYYRNNILHLFIIPALVARFARGHHKFTFEEVMQFVQSLYPAVAAELYLELQPEALQEYVHKLCVSFVNRGWLLVTDEATETDTFAIPTRDSHMYVQLVLLANAAEETLTRYSIVFELLFQSDTLCRVDLEQYSGTIASRIGAQHGIDAPEFYDKKVFTTLIQVLRAQGYVVVTESGCYRTTESMRDLSESVRLLLGSHLQLTIRDSTKRLLQETATHSS